MDAAAAGDEPEVDDAESGQYPPADAGLLGHLAYGSLLDRLAALPMALGQRPQQAPPPVKAPDQSPPGIRGQPVEHQAAGRELLDAP